MNDLTELPEKWCVQRTKEHGDFINAWFCDNNYGSAWRKDDDWIYIKNANSYGSTIKPKEMNYNCITFEQFEKWVMKKEPTETLLTTIL